MKKLVSLVAVGLIASTVLSGAAVAGKKKGVRQDVSGSILMQAPPSDATSNPNGCYSGVHRRINVIAQENVNGVVGYHFDIDPATWGGKFNLEVTGGQGDIDFDITFYTEFGTPEQATDTGYAPVNQSYEEREPGGETGTVPPEMNKAIVCMWAGESHRGVAGAFTYTASAPVKKGPKKKKK